MPTHAKTILGLDVGGRRIGVALADGIARLANPLETIRNDHHTIGRIRELIREHDVGTIVVGLPRGLDGQTTAQTIYTQEFVNQLKSVIETPIYEQDEALTSRQAESELMFRDKPYAKGDIDALAATYILEDYLREHD